MLGGLMFMSKFCTSCGAKLEDGAKFCFKCGAQQLAAEAKTNQQVDAKQAGESAQSHVNEMKQDVKQEKIEEPVVQQPVYTQPVSSPSEKGSNPMKFIAGFLAIAAIAVAFFAFSGSDKQTSKSGSQGKAAISIKAADMLDDYIRDQSSAELKYKDKIINISGKVIFKSEFRNTQNFQVVLARKSAAGKNYWISLDYPPEKVDEVNKKKDGDFVVAEGNCIGIVKQEKPTDISIQIHVGR